MSITNSWNSSVRFSSNAATTLAPNAVEFVKPPAQLDPADFQSWSREVQLAYMADQGLGLGPVQIGPVGNTITVEAISNFFVETYREVETDSFVAFKDPGDGRPATSAELDTSPSLLDPRIVAAWDDEGRMDYFVKQGNPASLTVGTGLGAIELRRVTAVLITGRVTETTAGDNAPIPYHNLIGSGASDAINKGTADRLFPAFNGSSVALDVQERPDLFGTAPSSLTTDAARTAFLESFTKWHSIYQLEYVRLNGTSGLLNIPTTGIPVLTAMASKSDPSKVFIVQNLDKADFSKMTKLDQDAIAATTAFGSIAGKVGLADIDTAMIPSLTGEAAAGPKAYVDQVIAFIDTKTNMSVEDRAPFIAQLEILKEQFATMGVVSVADVQKKVTAIKERFDRAFAFSAVSVPMVGTADGGDNGKNLTTYRDVVSVDDTVGIQRGYKTFIAQERRIAELAEERMKIVRGGGVLAGKTLDVPNLVYRFQSLYNLALEAEVVMETEEINQQNDLLKTYARMQDIVNQTLSGFEKTDGDNRRIQGLGVSSYGSISQSDLKVISMFEDLQGNGQRHPLETLRGITRPTFDMFRQDSNGSDLNYDLNAFSHPQWSTFGTRLSETVTIVNQNSQIKMNDINSLDKQRNRHFELANGALSKASEIINAIARS